MNRYLVLVSALFLLASVGCTRPAEDIKKGKIHELGRDIMISEIVADLAREDGKATWDTDTIEKNGRDYKVVIVTIERKNRIARMQFIHHKLKNTPYVLDFVSLDGRPSNWETLRHYREKGLE